MQIPSKNVKIFNLLKKELRSVTTLPSTIVGMMVTAALILFLCSSFRHALFQSTAWDLGIFDQAVYLISQGQPPISSYLGFHILGDHASGILYILAFLYKIYPDVHWLLAVQAIALALGAWPSWGLARLAGLNQQQAVAVSGVYLLYPLVFNINLFDFHPDVIALPALLGALLAARLSRPFWFCAAIVLVLSCKGVLALTVTAMGIWLLVCDKRSFASSKVLRSAMAFLAILAGVAWFLMVAQSIIPFFKGSETGGVDRYAYLGNSVLEITLNVFLKPGLVLGKIFSGETIKYLFLLCLPVIWGLSPKHLTPLLMALPTLLLNVLSQDPFQRSLAYQYSLPVIPFLLLAVLSKAEGDFLKLKTADADKEEEQNEKLVRDDSMDAKGAPYDLSPSKAKVDSSILAGLPIPNLAFPRSIIIWSLLIFLIFGKFPQLVVYMTRINTWQATREAIAQIAPQANVLSDNRIATHLSHRPVIKLLNQVAPDADLAAEFEYVVLNLRHPWPDTKEVGTQLAEKLKKNPKFKLSYQRDDVLLFKRIAP